VSSSIWEEEGPKKEGKVFRGEELKPNKTYGGTRSILIDNALLFRSGPREKKKFSLLGQKGTGPSSGRQKGSIHYARANELRTESINQKEGGAPARRGRGKSSLGKGQQKKNGPGEA